MVARSAEVKVGRTFGVTFEDGDDFFGTLSAFCLERDIKYGYIPTFIGALRSVRVAGSCRKEDEAEAPMFHSFVDLEYTEVVGGGTLAWSEEENHLLPHVHVALGERMRGANGVTSHLFAAEVQLLLEMVVVEVLSPSWTRPVNPDLHSLKLLAFGE